MEPSRPHPSAAGDSMDRSIARRVALAALLLGIVGDALFDRIALGINVPIAVALALVAAMLLRPKTAVIDRIDLWIPAVAILASLGVAIRTDPPIVALDVALAGAATLAWMICASGQPLTRRSALVVAAFGAMAGTWLGLGAASVASKADIDGSLSSAGMAGRRLVPIVRGLALAPPILLVLAALLASADAVFGRLIGNLLELPIDPTELVIRAIVVFAIAWLAAGSLSIAAGGLPYDPERDWPHAPARSLGAAAQSRTGWFELPGATEALVVLIAIDVLFGAFVAIQFAYLFGGVGTVLGTGITFSDYAREGYFQLVAVVAVAGTLIAIAEAAAHGRRTFLVAALVLIGLTFVILGSAAVRLGLYQQIYGWTELRFYVVASIAWLAAGGLILTILVLRDRMRWLVHGLALAAVAVTLVVTAIGPQAFITRQNLARALDPSLIPAGGHAGLDVDYIAGFGDDAIPEMVEALPRLDPESRTTLIERLWVRRGELDGDASSAAWPAWNLAREQAREALSRLPPP